MWFVTRWAWKGLGKPIPASKNVLQVSVQADLSKESFFSLILAKPHCKCLAAAVWLHRKEKKKSVWVLNQPVCSPSMSPQMFGTSWNIKIPTSVDYLKSCIVHQWWGGYIYIYISVCQITAFDSQSVLLKEELMQQPGKHDQTILKHS